jgi:prolyl oligopeptidase
MRHLIVKRLAWGMSLFLCALDLGVAKSQESAQTLCYPEAPRSETVDDYHGIRVADPFRPLEDLDAKATRTWVEAENKITCAFLESTPERPLLRARLTELWDYEKFSPPQIETGKYFFTYNTGLQNQGVLYVAESLTAAPRMLLDPNALSRDGTVALTGTEVSRDGKHLAYGIAAAGSDWNEWKVRDIATGADLPDLIRWVKFSTAQWSPDGKGFFYGRYPEPKPNENLKSANFFQKVYYHRLGTDQEDDTLIWEEPAHKEWRAEPIVTDDGRYLIFTVAKGTDAKHRIFYRPLDQPSVPPLHLVGEFDAEYQFLDNDGPVFWFKTNKNAPRGRIVAIDTRSPQPEHWKELIPESSETLESADVVGDRFLTISMKDAHNVARVFDLGGKHVRDIALPGLGTVTGLHGKRKDREAFYAYTSFSRPAAIYHYEVESGRSILWREPKLRFDPEDYVTEQVFYPSKDGTRIPLFLSYTKVLKRTGKNPTLLYGYGGFNIPIKPSFKPANIAWMERGGLYAVANLRGGGEYGEDWHQAGTKARKQNVFDDFIAAAEWLIAENYTSRQKLAMQGRSNGGLLVGACMTQRPDLFGACLIGVGVLDMLRFPKFTIGWAWVDDYGSSEHPDQFQAIRAYSPIQNVRPGICYPPTLITTADHDDRVFPAHSFKFAAALQEAQSCDNPVLIRIETRAGHGAGKPTTKQIEEAADELAFLVKVLRVHPHSAVPDR